MPKFEFARLRNTKPWRCVEAQAECATLAITESLGDQELLEAILDDDKPPVPDDARHLHWLAYTPFRYLRAYESRFGPAGERGIWYGAESEETALREFLYGRLTFFSQYEGAKPQVLQLSLIQGHLATSRMLDITHTAFNRQRSKLEARDSYQACHQLAGEARDQGVEVIRYNSVRTPKDMARRRCYAVLSPAAFGDPSIFETQSKSIKAARDAEAIRALFANRKSLTIPLDSL